MENALDKALANASLNARMNGDTLHTENLDSIAEPTSDTPQLSEHHIEQLKQDLQSRNFAEQFQQPLPRPVASYQQMMEAEYAEKVSASNATTSSIHHLSVLAQVISDKTNGIQQQLTDVYVQLSRIEATITSAAQSMSSAPNFKHRSLDQWDDSQLLNELVERENDLMPFYFELLKRIPRELQPHVDESMKGKYQSLGVLSKLCAALSYTQQPQPTQAFEVGLSESANRRMDEAFKTATSPQAYTPEQLANVRVIRPEEMSSEELLQYQEFQRNAFNKAVGNARNSPSLSPFTPYQTIPPQS